MSDYINIIIANKLKEVSNDLMKSACDCDYFLKASKENYTASTVEYYKSEKDAYTEASNELMKLAKSYMVKG